MNVLHLSDTSLSGSPIRISNLLNRYSEFTRSRHIVWQEKVGYRAFEIDMFGPILTVDQIRYWIYEWADVIHYHNRYERQMIFQKLKEGPPDKPSVIQIHSPRKEDEDFEAEARSGVPIACIAQYHPREWPEHRFIVPNVVDIWDRQNQGAQESKPPRPSLSFAPSNSSMKKWNDKGYKETHPVLKDLKKLAYINYQLITQQPHYIAMSLKRHSHIGIDEIITGSYHMSSLEYLSLGAACFSAIDEKCERVVKDLTGAETLPWVKVNPQNFRRTLMGMLRTQSWIEKGEESRAWMEKFWAPELLVKSYEDMYLNL